MAGYRKIVCCTDLSTNADKAFAVAGGLAQDWSADLVVLTIVSGGDIIAGAAVETWMSFKGSIQERMERKYPAPEGVQTELVMREGAPGKAIIDFLKETEPDLVVIGASGESAMRGLLGGGSVAEKVVRNSPVPVLVVPPGWSRA
jgi:nucleotide-binding universal stress UspA family protein